MIKATPWDTVIFDMPTWEILEYSETALKKAVQSIGHYTIKVDPLVDKQMLHDYGFYYCDTLIEPHCNAERLRMVQHSDATISSDIDIEQALLICNGAFKHDRFHRDFNLQSSSADQRYNYWLKQLLEAQQVYGLYWQGVLAGFIGHKENSLVLHAVTEQQRGKGLSKYWWSAVCCELFAMGFVEVKSSISVSNVAVLNLYVSMGFSFKNSREIYHRLVLK